MCGNFRPAAFAALVPAIAGCALAAVIAGCSHASDPRNSATVPITVRVAPVRRMLFAAPLELSGDIVASRQVAVGATIPGRIVDVLVRAGNRVSAGQVLARIDDTTFRAAFEQAIGAGRAADANAASARARVEAAQARLHLAHTTAARIAGLYAAGAVSHQNYDEAHANLAAALAALAQTQAEIQAATGSREQAGAEVNAAKVPLRDVIIRAPFDGIVLSRAVDPGAVVGPGSSIATIQDDRDLELDIALPEDAARGVRPGDRESVHVDALDGRALGATVRALTAAENPSLRRVIVKLDIVRSPDLLAGMFARVRLPGLERHVLAIPASALVTRAGQDGVFAIADGHATFIPIQTGQTHGEWIELLDLPTRVHNVAIDGVERLTDGSEVAIKR